MTLFVRAPPSSTASTTTKIHSEPPFDSIPAAFWVGHRDDDHPGQLVPDDPLAVKGCRLELGCVSGVLVLALPVPIFVNNFARGLCRPTATPRCPAATANIAASLSDPDEATVTDAADGATS